MAAAVRLRLDYDGAVLRKLARASRDAKPARRLLTLAAVRARLPRGTPIELVVAGRSARRPEERHHPTLGTARNTAFGTAGPVHRVSLHIRRYRFGRGAKAQPSSCPAAHRRDDAPPRRDPGRRSARAHAVLLIDQAGWHGARDLVVPDNITLLPPPPRSPEHNPVENVWQFMRGNSLSNRVFAFLRRHPPPLLPRLE